MLKIKNQKDIKRDFVKYISKTKYYIIYIFKN